MYKISCKMAKTFLRSSIFFHHGPTSPSPPQPALKFSKKPSPGRVNLKHTYNDGRATDSAKLD